MYCSECGNNNLPDAKLCTKCGRVLTQDAEISETAHCTGQVWNADIDREKNRKNSRVAAIVLGIGVVLLAALLLIAAMLLPSYLDSFSVPKLRLPDFSEKFSEPEPLPAPPPAAITDVDRSYLQTMESFLNDLYWAEVYGEEAEQIEVVSTYVDVMEAFNLEFNVSVFGNRYSVISNFEDHYLQDLALRTIDTLHLMVGAMGSVSVGNEDYPYIGDRLAWLEGRCALAAVAEELHTDYFCLLDDEVLPAYFGNLLRNQGVLAEVESDLQVQLPIEPSVPGLTEIVYTNNTPYTLDIIFYNDYITEEGILSDSTAVSSLTSGSTVLIPLKERPRNAAAENVVWTICWRINGCYLNGENILENNS